jgi:hypothetical protein
MQKKSFITMTSAEVCTIKQLILCIVSECICQFQLHINFAGKGIQPTKEEHSKGRLSALFLTVDLDGSYC